MEKQKNIPPLSTKITRKLAQVSPDYNSLMNFYSSISRDKSGAPKKWKMSAPLHIDENFISDNHNGHISTVTTPNSSLKISGERKNRSSLPSSRKLQHGKKVTRNKDGSSFALNCSHESSLDLNQGKMKSDKIGAKSKQNKVIKALLKDKNYNKKSVSSDNLKIFQDSKHLANSENYMLEKEDERQHKLRSPNMAMNGDYDKFKSPDRLTPCNVDVKRRKGRPKATPPTLVAESPINNNASDSIVNFECDIEEKAVAKQRRRCSKLKQMKKFTADKFKGYTRIKKFDGSILHQYTSKIKQNNLYCGFRKLPKFAKVEVIKNPIKDVDLRESVESEQANNDNNKPDGELSLKSKKIGRPIGSKSKPKFKASFVKAHKSAGLTTVSNDLLKMSFLKKNHKSQGVKTKIKVLKKFDTLETISNSSKENSVASGKDALSKMIEADCASTDKDIRSLNNINHVLGDEIETNLDINQITTVENKNTDKEFDALCEGVTKRDSIDECIDSVLFQAKNETLKPPVRRIKNESLRTKSLTGNGRVRSAGKIKKEIDKTNIMKKKKLLSTYAVNTDCIESLAHLASNDLRRKLHSKLILKLSSNLSPTPDQGIIKEAGMDTNDSFKTASVSDRIERGKHTLKQVLTTGTLPKNKRNEADEQGNNNVSNNIECNVQEQNINIASKMVDIQNLSALIEQRRVTKLDTEKPFEKRKRGRWIKLENDQKHMSKSDTESTCSEFSTNSYSSIKQQAEKHILVLEEDNLDSDANTVRTRQRFDIVPGTKHRRTLSGEFDLLDEKWLRKERKMSGKSEEAFKQLKMSSFDQVLCKHVKSQDQSPKLKVKDGEINKKYASSVKTANRNRLLKQSPFLNKVHKKQFVILKKQNYKVGPQEQANINDMPGCTPQENKKEFFSKPVVNYFKTCNKVLNETDQSETVTHNPIFNVADINSETKDMCIDVVKDELKETLHIKDRTDINTANVQAEDGTICESSVDRKSLTVKDITEVLYSLVNNVVNTVDVANQKLVDSSNVDSIYETSIDIPFDLMYECNVNGHNLKSCTSLPISTNKVLQCQMNLEKVQHCRKISFKQSKSGQQEKIQKSTARKTSTAVKRKVKFDTNLKIFNAQCTPRKFELRQKISRFPLENLALKQSLEENEFLKNEAQKAIKKEAKMKSKLPMLNINQEPFESVPRLPIEDTNSENQLQSVTVFETRSNIEKILQQCTPCTVILNDFIKQLQKAQSKTAAEMKLNESLESYEIESVSLPPSALENAITSVRGSEAVHMTENCNSKDQNCSVLALGENAVQCQNTSEIQDMSTFQENPDNKVIACDIANVHQQSTEAHGAINSFEKNAVVVGLKMPKNGHFELPLEMNANIVLNSVSGNDAQNIPKKSFERKTVKKSAKMKHLHNSFIPEQQTARKTVPPLKIKLKGGTTTRRKTYMVELPINPDANSSVAPKNVEKKEKICKLQTNSEKHSKIHVRRKRSLSVGMNKAKKDKTNWVKPIKRLKHISMQKDSYEANFMHFIQEKEKVKQNLMNFTNNLNTKFKSVAPLADDIPAEIQSNVNVMVNNNEVAEIEPASKSVVQADSNAFTHSHAFSLTDKQSVVNAIGQNMAQADTKNNAVQYVCSQCEDVIFKSEDGIVKHYTTFHPGAKFMYKPLLEDGMVENRNAIQMHGRSEDLIKNNVNGISVSHFNAKTQIGDKHYVEYNDDLGSLNLKIVDVVSLKDHVNALNDELPQNLMSRSDYVNTTDVVQTNRVSTTELNIPLYSISGVSPRSHLEFQKNSLQQTNFEEPQKKTTNPTKLGNTFKCEKCNVHAPLLAAMVAHLRSCHKDILRLFQCPYCKEMEAETEALIHLHIRKNHPTDNPNPPVALSETAKQNLKTLYIPLPENYKLSENDLIEKDLYMCLNCRVHMPSHDMIYEHLQQHHTEVFVFVCPYCKLFKSRSEEIVSKHVVSEHQRNLDVNILLAIDGNQFCRIQCLVKEKSRNVQKSQNLQNHQLPSPVPNLVSQTTHLHTHPLGSTQTVSHSNEPSTVSSANSLLQQTVMPANVTLSCLINNCTSPQQQQQQQQKKKKNLLESIQQLTMLKQMEQQGLVLSKPTASQLLPPNNSQINTTKSVPSALLPPLMRAPPPYISYDRQNQISASPTILLGPAIAGSSSITNYTSASALSNLNPASTVHKHHAFTNVSTYSHPQETHRKIQSSLFDTSDLDAIKWGPKPILNVPVLLKNSNRSQCQQTAALSMSPTNLCKAETGLPLDLSKHSPSQSPITLPIQMPHPAEVPLVQQCINPDIFQVFNLRPQNQQISRPNISLQGPSPQFVTQPILMPQQVRQNTPSTLAYRPLGPHMMPTSMPQFINMPMGTVFGNVMMSLSGIPQGLQALSVGGPVHGIPTQIVQMNPPPVSVPSAVTLINNPQSLHSITTQNLTTQSASAGEF